MDISVLTIFPELFQPFREHGMIRRAIEQNIISVTPINIRDFAEGRHKVTDDRPYGGGCGMVMKPEPLAGATQYLKQCHPAARVILLTPQGRVFNQQVAAELSRDSALILVCGRYEGIDERYVSQYVDDEITIGDYVLTGGEVAAMVVIDAVIRLIPGVLGGDESAEKDSFSNGLLEHAHYTRPPVFEGEPVPEVLLSGHHGNIDQWRLENAMIRTFLKRPDLLEQRVLSETEIAILTKWCAHIERIVHGQALHCADSLSGEK